MLDVFNEDLSNKRRAAKFDHDCREGICGMFFVLNGEAHGPIEV
jgi:succinate dehydrogenase/fumarate reductase-like Fe-S protein